MAKRKTSTLRLQSGRSRFARVVAMQQNAALARTDTFISDSEFPL
jgi:hypothetical protein